MGKVLIHTTLSLDGFMAKPDDDVSWGFKYGTDEMVPEVMKEIGAVVLGNRGFKEGTMDETRIPYGGMLKVPQFVVTHAPRESLTIGGLTFTFIKGIERAVAEGKRAAGDKSVALLGASIDQQCLRAGLVDEIMIHLAPVLLGKGIRLFENLAEGDIELERTGITATSQITSLRFRVRAG